MGYFFDTFYFEPGSRMTGIWQAGVDLDADTELVATASLVRFGRDQHDQLEADFMGSHLPFHFGGFHGVGPDGHPWAMMLQVAPSSAADQHFFGRGLQCQRAGAVYHTTLSIILA